MTSKLLSKLARETQSRISPVSYGHLRGKLNKQGFSEIAMYAAVARHCEENDIKPCNMANDMIELIKGCTTNAFFIRVDNRFSFLSREYHELRHGDLDKGEMKSPEQRGQFLCNTCHLVKKSSDKAGGKNGHCCKICQKEKVSISNKKRKEQDEAAQNKPPVQVVPPAQVKPKEKTMTENAVDIDALSQRKPAQTVPFKINEIIGDDAETAIKLTCNTQDLPAVLSALQKVKDEEK